MSHRNTFSNKIKSINKQRVIQNAIRLRNLSQSLPWQGFSCEYHTALDWEYQVLINRNIHKSFIMLLDMKHQELHIILEDNCTQHYSTQHFNKTKTYTTRVYYTQAYRQRPYLYTLYRDQS